MMAVKLESGGKFQGIGLQFIAPGMEENLIVVVVFKHSIQTTKEPFVILVQTVFADSGIYLLTDGAGTAVTETQPAEDC